MGVYYIIVNDTKKEYIDPYDLGDNFKLSSIMTGIHGVGVVDLLVDSGSADKYEQGYWAGDSIRILGDLHEDETEVVTNEYTNISLYVLANVYESHSTYREEIVERAEKSPEILDGLKRANKEIKFLNLNHKLKKMNLV